MKSLGIFCDGGWAALQQAVVYRSALNSHMICGDGEVVVLYAASKVAIDVIVAAGSLYVMNRAGTDEEEGVRREMHRAGAGEQLEEGFRDAASKVVTGEAWFLG
jgi:hypothetical protein